MLQGVELTGVRPKNKGHALFLFKLSVAEGLVHEMAYTTSEYSRFFEAFKYLRGRALRGE